jgi:predicted aldo/keto reductase-like oxidoreductase
MIYRTLGRTGLTVSALSVGTNRLRTCTQEQATAILNRALDKGITFISGGYGETQGLIGAAVAHRRSEYVLSSKATRPTAAEVRQKIEDGLRLFRTDHIDIYELDYVNRFDDLERQLGPGGAYEAIVEAKQKGYVRHIGCTSHRPEIIVRLIEQGLVETATFMNSFVQQYALQELLPLAKARGVGTIGIRPIDHGALAPAYRALAFALHSGVDVALSGMTTVQQVDENVAAAEHAFAVKADEVDALRAEAAALPTTGCRNCDQCRCPYELRIGFVLPLFHYRQRYGLIEDPPSATEPSGEAMWQRNEARARLAAPNCAACGQCEPMCPYGVPIVQYVQQIAAGA